MTGQELITLVMARLGNRQDSDLRVVLASEMLAAQAMFEGMEFRPWFLDATSLGVTAAQTETISLPADHLAFDEEIGYIAVLDPGKASLADQYTRLTRGDANRVREYFAFSTYALPEAYWLVGDEVHLRPIPDAIYTIQFRHYKRDTPQGDSATTNLWMQYASDLMLAEVGRRGALYHTQNEKLGMMFAGDVQIAKERLLREHERRMIELREIVINGEML